MAKKITKHCELVVSDNGLGNIAAFGATSQDRAIETTLAGDFKVETVDVTTTATAIATGTVDVSKIYEVYILNSDPDSSAAYLKVMSYDGTNSIEVDRLLPGNDCAHAMPPQSSGYPVLRLQASSGTVKASVKVIEAGDPRL